MGYRLVRHPFSLALEEASKAWLVGDEIYTEIFCYVMRAAGMDAFASKQLLYRALRSR